MGLNLLASKQFLSEFFKDPVKGMLLLCVVAIATLFTYLYKNQESEKDLLKKKWEQCETGNYLRDTKIDYLLLAKAQSDSVLNRIKGKLEAIEELKKQKNEASSLIGVRTGIVQ